MVDYAGKKLHLTEHETGELYPVECFVGILPCSGFTFAMASKSQESPDFSGCLGAFTPSRNMFSIHFCDFPNLYLVRFMSNSK